MKTERRDGERLLVLHGRESAEIRVLGEKISRTYSFKIRRGKKRIARSKRKRNDRTFDEMVKSKGIRRGWKRRGREEGSANSE